MFHRFKIVGTPTPPYPLALGLADEDECLEKLSAEIEFVMTR